MEKILLDKTPPRRSGMEFLKWSVFQLIFAGSKPVALENELQAELELPGSRIGIRDPSRFGIEAATPVQRRKIGIPEVHAIEQVERLKLKLEIDAFR